MATDKPDDFQQQTIEMLRAQQEAYVTAVKAWREALAAGEVQPPPSPEPTPLHMLPTATEMAEAYYAFAASSWPTRAVSWRRSVRPWPLRRRAPETMTARRRWLGLYQSVPPSIEPRARTALEMFQDTVARHRDDTLVHYF